LYLFLALVSELWQIQMRLAPKVLMIGGFGYLAEVREGGLWLRIQRLHNLQRIAATLVAHDCQNCCYY